MSYQVLARKWRPRTYPEMVGQQHVLQALVNALDAQRQVYVHMVSGRLSINGVELHEGDGATIKNVASISFNARQDSEALVFDLP